MINFSDPWSILGWLIIYMLLLFLVIIPLGIAVVTFIKQLKDKHRWQKANAGKLRCEVDQCKNFASHRTPNGFYCPEHRIEYSKKPIQYGLGSVSWCQPLDYIKGDV